MRLRKKFLEPHPAIQEKLEQEVTADFGFLRLRKIFFSQVTFSSNKKTDT